MTVLCVASKGFDPGPLASALRDTGVAIEIAEDTAAALWLLASGSCQVLVMELLEEPGRWELVEAALWQRPPARVIALSASLTGEPRRRAYEAGVWELAPLPPQTGARVPAVLLSSVKQALARREGGSVLVVDDCRDAREGIVGMLRESGYKVETATTASEAARRLKARDYDLVLTEVRKAGPDGYQVIRDARRLQARTPVVVLTAALDDAAFMRCVELGASGCLWKLSEPDDILRHIRETLAARAATRPRRV
ncbi:MAG: response regulator [Candidatus Polarisedimenticolia bacterium]